MSCELCQDIRHKLESELGNRVSRKLIDNLLGVDQSIVLRVKVCSTCGKGHYAKGLCYNHYMAARRGSGISINDLGQHIGRKGKLLCDFEGCDYAMEQRFKGTDGKWYCSHHFNEVHERWAKEAISGNAK